MPCFHPISAYALPGGGVTFNRRESSGRIQKIPCRNCIGCRLKKTKEWGVRCMLEAQLHRQNSWVTLTYRDETVPHGGTLVPEDLTLFLKRLRRHVDYHCDGQQLRYFACGEYGEICQNCFKSPKNASDPCRCVKYVKSHGRPHFHIVVFGYQFPDLEPFKVVRGNQYYTSAIAEKLWQKGYVTIGEVTNQSIEYTARYVMKKINGDKAEKHYERIDASGEIHKIKPEYNTMSRNPGIASKWFDSFGTDVYPRDEIVLIQKGGQSQLPKLVEGDPLEAMLRNPRVKTLRDIQAKVYKPSGYFDTLYKRKHGEIALQAIKAKRQVAMEKNKADNTPERLAVKEEIAQIKLKKKSRDLEAAEPKVERIPKLPNLHTQTDEEIEAEVEAQFQEIADGYAFLD